MRLSFLRYFPFLDGADSKPMIIFLHGLFERVRQVVNGFDSKLTRSCDPAQIISDCLASWGVFDSDLIELLRLGRKLVADKLFEMIISQSVMIWFLICCVNSILDGSSLPEIAFHATCSISLLTPRRSLSSKFCILSSVVSSTFGFFLCLTIRLFYDEFFAIALFHAVHASRTGFVEQLNSKSRSLTNPW